MKNENALLPVVGVTIVVNIILLILLRRRIAYRSYYMALLVLTLVLFFIVFKVVSSHIARGTFFGQLVFLSALSIRNLFRPLDGDFNGLSRIVATLGISAIVLLLLLYQMAQGPLGYH